MSETLKMNIKRKLALRITQILKEYNIQYEDNIMANAIEAFANSV